MDRPGVIGGVGAALGKKGINISRLQFARKVEGGEALLYLNTDSPADDAAVKALSALDNITAVQRLTI